jgi:hypothetical protein
MSARREFAAKALESKRIGFSDLRRLQRDVLPARITTTEEQQLLDIHGASRAPNRARPEEPRQDERPKSPPGPKQPDKPLSCPPVPARLALWRGPQSPPEGIGGRSDFDRCR